MNARFSIGSEVAVVLISTGFAWGCSVSHPHVRAAAPVTTSPHKQESARCAELAPLVAPLVEQRWVASASIAIVKNDEKMLCSFGSARGQGSASPDTLYEIGSLTKLFTGVLLAEQSEVGAVGLEQPLAEALPVALRAVGRPITLLDLATHRSGLPRRASNLAPRDPANPYIDYDEARLFDYMREVEPAPAGSQYSYSNLGAALLGDALAHRARTPYTKLLTERLLLPLKMADTHFSIPEAAVPRFAQGHDADDAPQPAWDFDVFAPAGALRSSARDMAQFLDASLWRAGSPLARAFSVAETPRADAASGRRIGLFFQTRVDGSIWHNGETGGFASYFAIDPAARCGVVLLLSTAFARADELGDRLLAYARGKAFAPFTLPPAFGIAPQELAAYEGDYDSSDDFSIHIERTNGHLYARATGQSPFRLWPSAVDQFYLRAVDARVTFERDDQARVTALVLDQGGEQPRAKRRM